MIGNVAGLDVRASISGTKSVDVYFQLLTSAVLPSTSLVKFYGQSLNLETHDFIVRGLRPGFRN